jgi:hypothetical protein
MAFRRDKSNAHNRAQEWDRWRAQHQKELVGIGLPPSVYSDAAHWLDFLENGHLHRHEDAWAFEFGHLSPGQMTALLRFLENEYEQAERPPPLLCWVRVRVGNSGTA